MSLDVRVGRSKSRSLWLKISILIAIITFKGSTYIKETGFRK